MEFMEKEKFVDEYENGRLGYLKVDEIPVRFPDTSIEGYGKICMDLNRFCDIIEEQNAYPNLAALNLALVHGSALYKNSNSYEMPDDLDILLISDLYEDDIVVPDKSFEPRVESVSYGKDIIKDVIVETEEPELGGLFIRNLDKKDSAIGLHLAYRSQKQFENALGDERGLDTVSINAYKEGVPLFGEIPDYGARDQLHEIEWYKENGTWNARIT